MANGDDLGFVPAAKTDDLGFVPAKKALTPQATIGPDKRGLLQRANDWWVRKPAYEGTLDSPGRSPREKAQDVGKGAAFASLPLLGGGLAMAPGATLLGLGGGLAGSYAGSKAGEWAGEQVGAPELGEDVGGLTGSVLGGYGGASSSRVLGNKAAALLRNPATAKQSQLGRPGSVKEILPPNLQRWTLPPWMIPKGEPGTPTNPGQFMDIPPRMPKPVTPPSEVDPVAQAVKQGIAARIPTRMPLKPVSVPVTPPFRGATPSNAVLGRAEPPPAGSYELPKMVSPPVPVEVPSAEGVLGSLPKPSGRLVVLPEEAQALDQMQKIATKRASEHGMQYAAGMRPAGGGRVPMTPTRTMTTEFSGSRGIVPQGNPTPFSAPLRMETDSLGIRWAISPDGYRVSIPRNVPDGAIENYARPKLAEQAQIHSSMRTSQ